MSKKTVLIIGAGILQISLIQEAKAMGLYVIVTDGNPRAPGFAHAYEHYVIDTYDIEGHRALVRELQRWESMTQIHLAGVCTSGADVAPTVAAAAEVAGTPGIPYAVAQRTHNKAEVRYTLTMAGLDHYQPRYASLYREEWQERPDLQQFCRESASWMYPYPCIIKPVSQRASRGVSRILQPSDEANAVAKAFAYGDPIILEECLIGTEHSAEILLDSHGRCQHFHVCDRFFSYDDGLAIELGHSNPSSLDTEKQQRIAAVLLASAYALDVTIGPFKADIMWTDDGPKILECTARCSGGWDSQWTYPQSSGDNLLRRILQVACGLPVDPQPLAPDPQRYVACAAIIPKQTGRITQLPELTPHWQGNTRCRLIWHVQPGDMLAPLQHNGQRAGFLCLEETSYARAWEQAVLMATQLAHEIQVT